MLSHFPLKKPRSTQVDVLKAVEKAFKDGYINVLLEAPVGSGKSALAIAVAKYYGTSHILTPRKSLQNQYSDDFISNGVVLMKGRNAYPCTYPSYENSEYNSVIKSIKAGNIIPIVSGEITCSDGPCVTTSMAKSRCTSNDDYPCPYNTAIDTAQHSEIIVHNLHSFIFQTYYTGHFEKRDVLIIDECHEVEGIIRDFAARKVSIPKFITDADMPSEGELKTLTDWAEWLGQYRSNFSSKLDNFGSSDQDRFGETLQSLLDLSERFGEKFVPSIERDAFLKRTKFIFIPEYIGNLVNQYLLEFGQKRLLMSGTIYNKSVFCRNLGLKEEETCFIRCGSTFPKKNRPIYLKGDYRVDTSHKLWDENFSEMIEKIKSVMDIFDDVKGLIHIPSYHTGLAIEAALKSTGRIINHTKDNFQQVLETFYASEEPLVLLSPTCQQGVDFKYDRARFQIVLRVPYANTSDAFTAYKVKNDFQWYNYQALVVFGQQIGRVNRSEDDFGVTVLLDDRFGKFLSKNKMVLPKWLTDAVIYK